MNTLFSKGVGVQEVSFKSRGETLLATSYNDSPVGVVLCPPHPLYGGSRKDTRIVRVARELALHDISAFCLDYGSYGRGVGEVQNVLDAISYMQKRVRSLGLLGYSFGAVVSSNAASLTDVEGFVAISIVRKVEGLKANLDFDCPKLFVHGKRDRVAPYSEFESIYAEARGRKQKLVLDTDHFYTGNYPTIIDSAAKKICKFFKEVFSKGQ